MVLPAALPNGSEAGGKPAPPRDCWSGERRSWGAREQGNCEIERLRGYGASCDSTSSRYRQRGSTNSSLSSERCSGAVTKPPRSMT